MTDTIKTIRIVRQGPAGPAGAAGIVQSVAGLNHAAITGDELKSVLALVPGADVQPYSANLSSLAGLTLAADKLTYSIGPNTLALADLTAAGRAMTGAASAAAQTALLSAFTGDAGSGGAKGLVPAPAAGDAAANKALFADGNWKPLGGGLSVGSTAIGGGANARILYDNNGALGEYSAAQAKSFLAIGQADVSGLTIANSPAFAGLQILVGASSRFDYGVTKANVVTSNAALMLANQNGIFFDTGTGGASGVHMWTRGDGVLAIRNGAENDFTRIEFGGSSSSFPALKRSGAGLQCRLADDTGFAALQGMLKTHNAYTAGAPAATGYLSIQDSSGTTYKVLVST